jgi:hypothetical protein
MDKAFNLVVFLGLFILFVSAIVGFFGKPNDHQLILAMILTSFACGLFMSILIIKILTD